MLFNWIAGVDGEINDEEHHEEESYIEVEENTKKSIQMMVMIKTQTMILFHIIYPIHTRKHMPMQ